jgi:hypothetical protein
VDAIVTGKLRKLHYEELIKRRTLYLILSGIYITHRDNEKLLFFFGSLKGRNQFDVIIECSHTWA